MVASFGLEDAVVLLAFLLRKTRLGFLYLICFHFDIL